MASGHAPRGGVDDSLCRLGEPPALPSCDLPGAERVRLPIARTIALLGERARVARALRRLRRRAPASPRTTACRRQGVAGRRQLGEHRATACGHEQPPRHSQPRTPARARRQVSPRSSRATCYSPNAGSATLASRARAAVRPRVGSRSSPARRARDQRWHFAGVRPVARHHPRRLTAASGMWSFTTCPPTAARQPRQLRL
jgi:hypothetical protein